jgi:hypothetical protein
LIYNQNDNLPLTKLGENGRKHENNRQGIVFLANNNAKVNKPRNGRSDTQMIDSKRL